MPLPLGPGESHVDVLRRIEGRYFVGYLKPVGLARDYVADTLRDAMLRDPNEIRRRLHTVALVTQEYLAYEDAAALLKGWLDLKAGRVQTPLEVIYGYRPGEAKLDLVLQDHSVVTGADLFERLDLSQWIPPAFAEWYPQLDLEKTVRLGCDFVVNDCRRNQKKAGVTAFNKFKHGLFLVPSAVEYVPELPDSPAALIPNVVDATAKESYPLAVYAFPSDDESLEERGRVVHFVSRNLRLLVALYLSSHFPNDVAREWPGEPRAMFASTNMLDILELIQEVTRKR